MKKLTLLLTLALGCIFNSQAQTSPEYRVVTIVESIIPAGLGRSRMIDSGSKLNVEEFTTSRTNGKKSSQGDVKRSNVKIDEFEETKMLNFFSPIGINFQNIASNDALIESKINQLAADGWELVFVTSAVESDAGKPDGQGLFITRMIFKK